MQDARDFYESGAPTRSERRIEILPRDETGAWLARWMEDNINELLSLPNGWDGVRAREVSLDAARSAGSVAFAIALSDKLPPQVFPLADGGLQLEWHAAGLSLEIEIDGIGDAHVLAVDENDVELVNGELSLDTSLNVDSAKGVLSQIAARIAGVR